MPCGMMMVGGSPLRSDPFQAISPGAVMDARTTRSVSALAASVRMPEAEPARGAEAMRTVATKPGVRRRRDLVLQPVDGPFPAAEPGPYPPEVLRLGGERDARLRERQLDGSQQRGVEVRVFEAAALRLADEDSVQAPILA